MPECGQIFSDTMLLRGIQHHATDGRTAGQKAGLQKDRKGRLYVYVNDAWCSKLIDNIYLMSDLVYYGCRLSPKRIHRFLAAFTYLLMQIKKMNHRNALLFCCDLFFLCRIKD